MEIVKTIEDLKDINSYVPTKKQMLLHNSKSRYNFFGGSMGCGKSVALVNEIIHYCLRYDGAIALLCRKNLNSLKKTTVTTLQQWLPNKYLKRFNKHEMIFEFKNGSKILCFGLSDYEALQRIKGVECAIFGIDEASDIDDDGEAFQMLTTRLRQDIGALLKGILTSNPCRVSWIRKLFIDQRQRGYRFIPALPRDNKHLKKGYISDLRRSLTEQQFEILALGKWEKAQPPSAIFEYNRVMEAVKRKEKIGKDVAYGVDPGLDKSESVLIKRTGNKIEIVFAVKDKSLREVANKVKSTIRNKKALIYCDAVGIGAGLIGLLEDRDFKNVIPVKQNEQAENDNMFFNRRAENYHKLYEMLDSLNLPDDAGLREEMLSLQKLYDPNGRLKIENKAALVKKGRSPSRLDALVLSCQRGEGIEEEDESELLVSYSQWRRLDTNLAGLERKMTLAEKTVDLNNKEDLKICEKELLLGWKKRRSEYDRLIALWNRITGAARAVCIYDSSGGIKRRYSDLWVLKTRPMKYPSGYSLRSMGRDDIVNNDKDNPDVDIEVHLEEEIESDRGHSGEVARSYSRTPYHYGSGSGEFTITGEQMFGRGDLPPESGGEE